MPACLNNLDSTFLCHLSSFKDLVDINRTISAHKWAIHLTPDGHADKPHHLNNFANLFLHHFECFKDILDIDRAISAHKQTVHLTLNGHADKAGCLSNLGRSFLYWFNHSVNPVDRSATVSHLQCAASCSTAPSFTQFHAATQWACLASRWKFSSAPQEVHCCI